jgi:sialidase-1
MRHSICLLITVSFAIPLAAQQPPAVRKLKDVVVYSDDKFYCAFPSIVRRADGELIVAFRRAPERRAWGETGTTHTDPNSYLVLVRSKDGGQTWSKEPEMVYAHPFGGSQDPCMVQLRDGLIVCTSYGWAWAKSDGIAKMKEVSKYGNFVFLGGYIVRSEDGGHRWSGPIFPAPCEGETTHDLFGQPVPAYNRGAMCEGEDGRLYWIVASNSSTNSRHTSTHLMISSDKGRTWKYSCPIAVEEKFSINESSLYQTPKGDLVAFMRTEGFNDHTIVARSRDLGKTFQPWIDAGFQGHPHHVIALPDKRVLLVYGYRHRPFGIRVRVLDAECTRFDSEEIVLRDDGGNGDLGYPWATMIGTDRALVVYYFNKSDRTRHIAGTLLELKSQE